MVTVDALIPRNTGIPATAAPSPHTKRHNSKAHLFINFPIQTQRQGWLDVTRAVLATRQLSLFAFSYLNTAQWIVQPIKWYNFQQVLTVQKKSYSFPSFPVDAVLMEPQWDHTYVLYFAVVHPLLSWNSGLEWEKWRPNGEHCWVWIPIHTSN